MIELMYDKILVKLFWWLAIKIDPVVQTCDKSVQWKSDQETIDEKVMH